MGLELKHKQNRILNWHQLCGFVLMGIFLFNILIHPMLRLAHIGQSVLSLKYNSGWTSPVNQKVECFSANEREPNPHTSQYSDDILRDMTAVQIVLLERELWEHVKQLEESYRKL